MEENVKAKILNCEFEFKCPKRWEKLAKTYLDNVRFCKSCAEKVYFAENQETLGKMRDEGKCVAFLTEEEEIIEDKNTVEKKSRHRFVVGKVVGVGRPKQKDYSETEIAEQWNNLDNSDK